MNLNLARKWRPRTFEQMVGQELPVSLLKNGLYTGRYFPVYLFAGQRGCGKTTAARIFAASINCQRLHEFQQNPKMVCVPCYTCISCKAMMENRHPDFIEIDAASHTGVDNVRQIIEAASLLPVLGSKRMYLIDEAHMLSKAAFNAFLKILEEPPASVFFMLATTDMYKIIDTVRSRCFQLFFKPIRIDCLVSYLTDVCTQENITYETEGLRLIVMQAEGSARDALNILEQVRFACTVINKDSVSQILGHMDETSLAALLRTALHANKHTLLKTMEQFNIASFDAYLLWADMCTLLKDCIWFAHGVIDSIPLERRSLLATIVQGLSLKRLIESCELFYQYEPLFLKSRFPGHIVQMILLKLSPSQKNNDMQSILSEEKLNLTDNTSMIIDRTENHNQSTDYIEQKKRWMHYLNALAVLDDPLINSIFTQARFVAFDQDKHEITIAFTTNVSFFNDLISSTEINWKPLLQKIFGETVSLIAQFIDTPSGTENPRVVKSTVTAETSQKELQRDNTQGVNVQQTYKNQSQRTKQAVKSSEKKVDIQDKNQWPKAHMVLGLFSGKITEVTGDFYA